MLLSQGAEAETIAQRLTTYHSKAADVIIADFGAATTRTPNQLVYSFNELRPETSPTEPGPVDPALGARRNGVGMGSAILGLVLFWTIGLIILPPRCPPTDPEP